MSTIKHPEEGLFICQALTRSCGGQEKSNKMPKNIGKLASKMVFMNHAKYALLGLWLIGGFLYPAPAGITLADFEVKLPANAVSTPQTALISAPGIKLAQLEIKKVYITAYSSTPEETDDTPFITASGRGVRDGIVASNFLAIGTKIRIPAIFGDKVFVVEDRMHPRMTNVVDVWMPTKDKAKKFGRNYAEIEILEEI